MEKMYLLRKILLLSSVLILFSCEKEDILSSNIDQSKKQNGLSTQALAGKTIQGDYVAVGDGFVFSWVTFNKSGELMEIGIDITPEVYESLPKSGDFESPVNIPFANVVKDQIPFDHVGLNWDSGGSKNPILSKAHLDIHFYMISMEERMRIPVFSDISEPFFNNYPPPGYFAAGYKPFAKNSRAEAKIGNHWLVAEKDPKPLDYALFLGSYNGLFTFIDPMVSLDFIKSDSQLISQSFPQPDIYPSDQEFPKHFNIYTSKAGNNSISLSNFNQR
ncbi:hypothetical protein [Flavobacterium pedocola]